MDQEEMFQLLLQTFGNSIQNNETSEGNNKILESQENNQVERPDDVIATDSITKCFTKSESETQNMEIPKEPTLLDVLQDFSKNKEQLGNQEQLNQLLLLSALSGCLDTSTTNMDNNSNFVIPENNQIDMEDTTNEWLEEYSKLDRDSNCKYDKKDDGRRRQMAKNREYARKCVQKKKDMRKQAEIRNSNVLKKIEIQQKLSSIKEKNANFAVELRTMIGDLEGEKQRKHYEQEKINIMKESKDSFSQDEAVNLAFHKLSSAKEEFEKAANDLRQKNGVVGTLGSRKIRAKQQMEWRHHLYNISTNEHKLRCETKLLELADDYVRQTVPQAAPLVQSIPKNLLDELIKNERTSDLEEFVRFVGDNKWIFDADNNHLGDVNG